MARRAGSGRIACENCLFIDVRDWNRRGYLRAGQSFTWSWNRAGKPIGSISVRTEADAAILTYRSQRPGEIESRPVQQRVPIVWTMCNLGGCRPWFRCIVYSGSRCCGRRAAILYAAGDLYACRHCYGLAYLSQRESPRFRNISRSRKIRMRLGGVEDLCAPFPPKPHGMHRSTYYRLRARGEAADREVSGQLRFPRGPLRRYQAERSKLR
jgi:hypothetical protein